MVSPEKSQQYMRHNGNGNRGPRRAFSGTPPEHRDWRTYTFVEVFVQGLPRDTRTVDVHKNLKKYGNIVRISLRETRSLYGDLNAEVVFKPPPDLELWQPGLDTRFRLENGFSSRIIYKLSDRQRKNFEMNSPTRPMVKYGEETILDVHSIDFGILRSDKSMTVMKSTSSMTQKRDDKTISIKTQMILNLKQMQIEFRFPVWLESVNGARLREYRFWVALDDKFSIWEIQDATGSVSYTIHITNPPWYSRRLEQQVAMSHTDDGKSWKEDDMWSRQTDIVPSKDHYNVIDRSPVEMRKKGNSINIARWTTFRVNLASSYRDNNQLRIVREALRDFNIKVIEMPHFRIDYPATPPEAPYWSLVPTITETEDKHELHSAQSFDLPFELRYQLEVCISQGWLSEYDITDRFLVRLQGLSEQKATQMLAHVDAYQERIMDPMSIFEDMRFQKPVKARQLPQNCVWVHHVSVTATGVKLQTPTVEQSNRIIRKYKSSASHFLRVRFEDDDYRGQTKLYAATNNKMVLVFGRVRRTMKYGIIIAGRHYQFLAWGNSQLREHGCYFFADVKNGVTAQQIRAEMGAFDNEKIVAKRAARMGQCFSTTSAIPVRIAPVSIDRCIPDVVKGRFTFTDGVGKISPLLAGLIHSNLKIAGPVPSCFQFRLGGCKGVLTVDPTLPNIGVKVRASQFKFDSTSRELEIIRWSEFWQPFLNRQLILVLSDLGVPDAIFKTMQADTVRSLNEAMEDDSAALKALRDNVDPNRMTLNICDLIESGFRRVEEPFVMSVLNLWRSWSLKYIKEKAKIPIRDGCFVLGVVDETATLRGHFINLEVPQHGSFAEKVKSIPEIFVQVTNPQTGQKEIIEGVCILARNPSLHKGDIRVVRAIDVKALHHLCDVVVMPQTGDRDLPSMCSGGDLDGDEYIVCWDQRLIPPVWNAEPFHYEPPAPKTAAGLITTEHIIDFFYDYLQNDFLGRIAHAHLATGDYYDDGIENEHCLELVHLHSMAVDYPKTGVPALLPKRLERFDWPHYMEKKSRSYHAWKILGQLYDAVKREHFKLKSSGKFDSRILNALTPSDAVKIEARSLKHEYDVAMQQIMAQHKIATEFEVWSTFVLDHSKASRDFKFHEEIGQMSKTLKERFHQSIIELCGGSTFADVSEFAVAAYQITAEEFAEATKEAEAGEAPSMPFISFPWLLSDTLGKIATWADMQRPAEPAKAPPQSTTSQDAATNIDTTMERAEDQQDTAQPIHETAMPPIAVSASAEVVTAKPAVQAVAKTADKAVSAPKKGKDPFLVLDPFKGIQVSQASTKLKSKSATPSARLVQRSRAQEQNKEEILSSKSIVTPQKSEPTEGPTITQREVESDVVLVDIQEDIQRGKQTGTTGLTTQQPATTDGMADILNAGLLNDGMMKDPAQMSVGEIAALGLDDEF